MKYARFAEWVKNTMEKKKLSYSRTASLAGISISSLQCWRRGMTAPSRDALYEFCKLMGANPIDAEKLIYEDCEEFDYGYRHR